MLARARRGVCENVAGAALWRCRCRSRGRRSILCIWVCVCVAGVAFGSCLEGQDVGARAAGGVRNRGRRSTLAMPLPKSWQAQHSVHLGVCLCGRGSSAAVWRDRMLARARRGVCEIVAGAALWRCRCRSRGRRSILCIWVCVCVAGVAFGSCLEGQDVVARAAGACEIVAAPALWRCRCLCRGRRCVLCAWVWRCHCRSRGRRSILCIWVCVCVAGQAQHSAHLGVRFAAQPII